MKTIRYTILSIVLFLAMIAFSETAQAQARNARTAPAPAGSSIPKDKQPWKGIPWVIGGVLSAGVIAVGFKNSKRTHLD